MITNIKPGHKKVVHLFDLREEKDTRDKRPKGRVKYGRGKGRGEEGRADGGEKLGEKRIDRKAN